MPTKYYHRVVFFGSVYKYTKVIKLKKTIDSILKQISNRTYQIKNSIEFLKFQAGYG